MPTQVRSVEIGLKRDRANARSLRIALNEHEVAARWGISVKTLRRWRQEALGPTFCKFGSRVTYLIAQVEAFERRMSRHSTAAKVHP